MTILQVSSTRGSLDVPRVLVRGISTSTSATSAVAQPTEWTDERMDQFFDQLIAETADTPTADTPTPALSLGLGLDVDVAQLPTQQYRMFVPTMEWQVVEPDHVLPVGLEIRMSLTSDGISEARLPTEGG